MEDKVTSELIAPASISPDAEVVIDVKDLWKSFGENKVLQGFDLRVRRGESVMVLGKSGSGKSVLIKCIVRLLNPDKGSVTVLGEDMLALEHEALDRVRVKIGFLFQSSALYDSMTVRENLEFPLRRHWIAQDGNDSEALVKEALENVGLMNTIDMYPSELSGGMRRRIGLARTLILKPEIVLYDEPTTGLDPITSKEIVELILRLQKKYGTSSVIISHDMSVAKLATNRIVVLMDGRNHAEGTYDELHALADPKGGTILHFHVMANERTNTFKLGIFVLSAVVVLVLSLYLLGLKQDMFSRTLAVSARFADVNGLREGNNVRYAGIDVGTVKDITIVSDTEAVVNMVIRRDAAEHVHANAIASIASDGLMGNKLVKIEPGEGAGTALADGAVLHSSAGIDTDAMLRVLGTSNENLVAITGDLRELTHRMNTANGPLTLLTDTLLVADVRSIMTDLNGAAANARAITERANNVVRDLQAGKGALGMLVSDTAAENRVRELLASLGSVSDSLTAISGNINRFAKGLDAPGGLGHTLTRDTAVVVQVKRVVANMDSSAYNLNQDLRALQRNWFFRKYFKEKERGTR